MKNGKQAADTLIWIYIIKLLRIRLHGALPQLKYVYIFTYLCLLDSKYFRPRKLHTKLDLTYADKIVTERLLLRLKFMEEELILNVKMNARIKSILNRTSTSQLKQVFPLPGRK